MMVHVRQAKGLKDRYVPLPQSALLLLRRYWASHRHPRWLFPSAPRAGQPWQAIATPVCESSVQRAFQAALTASGIQKSTSVHTLRHSYATHLKVRYYGFFSPSPRAMLHAVRRCFDPAPVACPAAGPPLVISPPPAVLRCPKCGQVMTVVATLRPAARCSPSAPGA